LTHPKTIRRNFFELDTAVVAQKLIGSVLVSTIDNQVVRGRIVETEAYLPKGDSACHAAKHRTPRTEVMFGPAGVAYVYPIHAKHCFNGVTASAEQGCAVLIRALEPIEGVETIEQRRGLSDSRRLTTGPANLCQALGIDRSINGLDLTTGVNVWLEQGLGLKNSATTIKSSKRIGVTSAKNRRLRFYLANNPFVSGTVAMRT